MPDVQHTTKLSHAPRMSRAGKDSETRLHTTGSHLHAIQVDLARIHSREGGLAPEKGSWSNYGKQVAVATVNFELSCLEIESN